MVNAKYDFCQSLEKVFFTDESQHYVYSKSVNLFFDKDIFVG